MEDRAAKAFTISYYSNEKATNKLSVWEESTPSKGRLSPFGGGDLVSVDIGPSPGYSIVIGGENFNLNK